MYLYALLLLRTRFDPRLSVVMKGPWMPWNSKKTEVGPLDAMGCNQKKAEVLPLDALDFKSKRTVE